MIDDFDHPLLLAAAENYAKEAENFYALIFPKSIIDTMRGEQIDLRVILMSSYIFDIPNCITSH